MLEWIKLKSDNLNAIAYQQGTLYVRFNNNTCYYYENVPLSTFQAVLEKTCISKSKGVPSHGATFYYLVRTKYKGYRCPF